MNLLRILPKDAVDAAKQDGVVLEDSFLKFIWRNWETYGDDKQGAFHEKQDLSTICRDIKTIVKFNEVYISRSLSNTADDGWKAISKRSWHATFPSSFVSVRKKRGNSSGRSQGIHLHQISFQRLNIRSYRNRFVNRVKKI